MFGDSFSQRGDYSMGLFYGGHRKYLNSDSHYTPPPEFQTKQLAHRRLQSAGGTRRTEEKRNFLTFTNKTKEDDHNNHHHHHHRDDPKKLKKLVNVLKNVIVLDHFTSLKKEDWVEEYRAGVKLWVNKNTGEVTTVCPWAIEDDSKFPEESSENQKPIPSDQNIRNSEERTSDDLVHFDENIQGTGALVYDNSAINELFDILDQNTK